MFQMNFNMTIILSFCAWILLTILWIRWRLKRLRLFEELQIPGPKPHFIFGNILEIRKKGFLQCQEEWIKKYGSFVGYYDGLKPVLMITDKNILRRIFIKDFHLFHERPDVVPLRVHSILDPIIPGSEIMDNLLLNLNGEKWKRVRNKISPVFSANKLKKMISFVDKISEVTISILEEKAKKNQTTDVYKLFEYLTLDVIGVQAFALNTNAQVERDKSPLYRSAKTIVKDDRDSKIYIFGLCFPEVSVLGMALNYLKMFYDNGFSIPPLKITNTVGKVIEQRRKDPEMKRPDILQSLIDVYESPDATHSQKPEVKKLNDSDSREKPDITKSKLTDIEIKANALVVFLAGYETTSSALAYMVYMLAKYPTYQAEIQKEIDGAIGNEELNYYNLNSLQVLERFMMETMRFYSPGINLCIRVATEDVDFGSFTVPKGMQIAVPVNYMHFSEDNWEKPKVFDPDRFLPQRRTHGQGMCYWVFGIGPRNCIGMRLANITAKVILTKMLQKFIFELPDNPEKASLSVKVKIITLVPNEVYVKVKERESHC